MLFYDSSSTLIKQHLIYMVITKQDEISAVLLGNIGMSRRHACVF